MENNNFLSQKIRFLEAVFYIFLFLSLLAMQYQIWLAPGSIADNLKIKTKIEYQIFDNMQKQQKNEQLNDKIQAAKKSDNWVESKARYELGMIKPGEQYFQINYHKKS